MPFSDTDRGRRMEELQLLEINFSVSTTKETTTITTFPKPDQSWTFDAEGHEILDPLI
jgi:hypothetical protein